MAADWIKMRTDLQSHPKIVRILSATRTDKFRVIGGLHAVWSVFDAHSVDGSLHGYTPDLLDHVIGWEGFARALESVGWLAFDGLETLTLPEFETHNGQSAKRRAEDQKRKKNDRKASDICPQSVQNSADKKRTREEKRREEKEEAREVPPAEQKAVEQEKQGKEPKFVLPDWINPQTWRDFEEMRNRKRQQMTNKARALIVTELIKLRDAGNAPNAVLDQSTRNSWQDVYALKDKSTARIAPDVPSPASQRRLA